MAYNGYRNWNQWNVSLWLNNEESLYRVMVDWVRIASTRDRAANLMVHNLQMDGVTHTPDGAPITKTAVLVAMRGL